MKSLIVAALFALFFSPKAYGQKQNGCPVVEIRVGREPGNGVFDQGTGFVAKKGVVVTVKHVIEESLKDKEAHIYVDIKGKWRIAELAYAPPVVLDAEGRETQEGDLAILRMDTDDLPSLPLAETVPKIGGMLASYQYQCGNKVEMPLQSIQRETRWVYHGCPWCIGPQWRIYSAIFFTLKGVVPNGASGSPVLNKKGEVIGLVFSGNDCSFCNYSIVLDIAEARLILDHPFK